MVEETNFLDMLDRLPLEQRQPFIDHFVQTILGKTTLPLIQSKSFTISNDSPIEEKIRLTALAHNVDPASIDREDYERGEKEMSDSKIFIKELIKEHYGKKNNTGQRSKDDELISLGKFLYSTDNTGYQIIPIEEPDFILKNDIETIGVEHTRLEAEIDKAYVAELWKKYLKDTLTLIITERPGLTGVINLTLNADVPIYDGQSLRNFKANAIKNNIKSIHRTLADCCLSEISGELLFMPAFVKSISYQHSKEPFVLKHNEQYFIRTDFEEMVKAAIKKKEKHLHAYRANHKVNTFWLLLVYSEGGLSSSLK